MKHATLQTLNRLTPLLEALRAMAGLKEKTPGNFYLKSRAFLHFHEDPAGLFADIRDGADFDRTQVDSPDQQARLIERVRKALG